MESSCRAVLNRNRLLVQMLWSPSIPQLLEDQRRTSNLALTFLLQGLKQLSISLPLQWTGLCIKSETDGVRRLRLSPVLAFHSADSPHLTPSARA